MLSLQFKKECSAQNFGYIGLYDPRSQQSGWSDDAQEERGSFCSNDSFQKKRITRCLLFYIFHVLWKSGRDCTKYIHILALQRIGTSSITYIYRCSQIRRQPNSGGKSQNYLPKRHQQIKERKRASGDRRQGRGEEMPEVTDRATHNPRRASTETTTCWRSYCCLGFVFFDRGRAAGRSEGARFYRPCSTR
jgi:hypothetical protein